MVIRRCVLIAALVGLVLWPIASRGAKRASASPAPAQSMLHLATLTVDVWLEYDRPATVLVIYRGELAPGAPLPASVQLRIPASVEWPSAVASPRPGGEAASVNEWTDLMAAKQVTTTRSGDWLQVAFAPLSRFFTLEYYDALNTATFDRQYTWTWPSDMAADAVTVNVREPFGATNFQATPALPPGVTDDDGLVAHRWNLAGLVAGQSLALSLNYQRKDQRTSVEALQLITPAPARQLSPAPASASSSWWLLVAALIAGLALVLGGVAWRVRSRPAETFRPYEPPGFRRGRGRRNARASHAPQSRLRLRPTVAPLPEASENSAGFCVQCGKPLRPDDIYCSRCGARVKGK